MSILSHPITHTNLSLLQREKVRIGYLVERVENVKRNSQGNGIEECVLCATAFGRFKAQPHQVSKFGCTLL